MFNSEYDDVTGMSSSYDDVINMCAERICVLKTKSDVLLSTLPTKSFSCMLGLVLLVRVHSVFRKKGLKE